MIFNGIKPVLLLSYVTSVVHIYVCIYVFIPCILEFNVIGHTLYTSYFFVQFHRCTDLHIALDYLDTYLLLHSRYELLGLNSCFKVYALL